MALTLEKGSEGRFVEIEQDDIVKRFLVPDVNELEGRIRTLVQQKPGLALVRIGRAIVASKDEASELNDGIEGVPSHVIGCYNIDFCGDHPILGSGSARYSQEFIQTISTTKPQKQEQPQVEIAGQSSIYDFKPAEEERPTMIAVDSPKDLSATLRQQLAQQVLNTKTKEKQETSSEVKLEVVKTEEPKEKPALSEISTKSASETQKKLDEAVQKAKTKREDKMSHFRDITISNAQPKSKIDVLLEKVESIESILVGELTDGITADDMKAWFWEHYDTIGPDKTFAILASRIKK